MKQASILITLPVTYVFDGLTVADLTAMLEANLQRAISAGLLTGDNTELEVLNHGAKVQVLSEVSNTPDESKPDVEGFVHAVGDTGVPLFELSLNACLSEASADTLVALLADPESVSQDTLRELARHDPDLKDWLKANSRDSSEALEVRGCALAVALDDDALRAWLAAHRPSILLSETV